MAAPNVFEKKDWDLSGLSHWRLVGFILPVLTQELLANISTSACIASVLRLYFSVKLSTTKDVNYYVGLMGLWTIPEMASGFLAMCLPVFPRFFQSLKRPYSFSWTTIWQRYHLRSSRTAGYQPSPDHLVSRSYQPKKSTLWPSKQDSPVYIPTISMVASGAIDQGSEVNSSKFETGNLHIMRSIHISTSDDSGDAGMQGRTNVVSNGW